MSQPNLLELEAPIKICGASRQGHDRQSARIACLPTQASELHRVVHTQVDSDPTPTPFFNRRHPWPVLGSAAAL